MDFFKRPKHIAFVVMFLEDVFDVPEFLVNFFHFHLVLGIVCQQIAEKFFYFFNFGHGHKRMITRWIQSRHGLAGRYGRLLSR